MEVTAFYIALLTVMILLCAQDQEVDAAFLRIAPNRLQFFEYESVTLYCDGVFYCVVEHTSVGETPSCCTTTDRTSRGPNCTIENVFQVDSGKYWCEEGGERRNIINITVTSGSVILESPALPVMEGEDVTLSCRTKISSSNIQADFYKDGVHRKSSSPGTLSIRNVSMSDQGLYKCDISGVGESPQSWLTVRVFSIVDTKDTEDHVYSNPDSSSAISTPWIIIAVLLTLFLLVVGLLLWFGRFACRRGSVQANAAAPSQPIYTAVSKTRKKNAESRVRSATRDPVDNDVCYSTVKYVAKR
ncbi:low affinity immunoglobulin gamma Fc region receptor III-like isoform X2 [Mugil cephalus]|uniref:low affinity immunoglobulin gamma Fc region receptor III-like isoform X2 n=1 Tax=Mugil cephalus TaxID=48193 RepID=UPI001FB5B2FF|nr:low affinity immunoglobulin gamma Fc region receptor III-like isoform X2 [Mugil cephalus]